MTILPEQPGSGRAGVSTRLVVVALIGVAAVVAVVLVVVNRGGSSHRTAAPVSSSPSPSASASRIATKGWRADVHAVTQPAPVAGRFVVYAANGGKLQLIGLDAATGRTVWTRPASASSIAPGVAPIVTVVGRDVVFVQDNSFGGASIVSADAATGATVWRSQSGAFTTWPTVCADDDKALCASGHVSGGPDGAVLRLDAATGQLLPTPSVGGAGGREVGNDLFDTGERNPEVLVATSGSSTLWQQPLQRIFDFHGASTDYGWNFDRLPRLGVYIGSVGAPPLVETSSSYVSDVSRGMSAGFRIRDGHVLWRAPGTQYICTYLPCAGAANTSYSSQTGAPSNGPSVGILIRAHGRISGSPDSIQPTVSKDATAVLEGVDPATGTVRWRFDAGHNIGVLTGTASPPRVSATTIAMTDRRGRLEVLDVATGAAHAASPTTRAMCSSAISYRMDVGYQTSSRTIHEYVGAYALTPCTVTGRPISSPAQATPALAGLVTTMPGVAAWTQKDAVVAVPTAG